MQATLYESVTRPAPPEKQALVAFGANLAAKGLSLAETLLSARAELAKLGLLDRSMSPIYRTPCFPAGAGPDYLNAVAAFSVAEGVTAEQILGWLHQVEAAFGRTRDRRWGARTLDLDLLALGDLVLPDAATQNQWRALPADRQAKVAPDRLILPHPRLQDRAFVLVPMADVDPDWRHPRLGLTVRQMLAALPPDEVADVTPI
jgi:2-amino-4-hydroxy-6-hydroxymethyldihydropteridine diphosphokinase